MIGIIDCGSGNPGSIQNMLRKIGYSSILISKGVDLLNSSAIIFPGVGAYDNVCQKLQDSGFIPYLDEAVLSKKIPFLGICVGMQLLFEGSEEGVLRGLNWIPGYVKRFNFKESNDKNTLKIPHMGWNVLTQHCKNPIIDFYLYPELRYYFVHSYHVVCDERYSIAKCNYGYNFTCAVRKDNIFGVQFHPEKSHKFGMMIFRKFVEFANVTN